MASTAALMTVNSASELPALARRCVSALGEELTAYLTGAVSVAELDAWRTGGHADAHASVRLAAAAELIRIFAAENLLSHLPHWLREVTDSEDGPLVPARAVRAAGQDIQPIKTVLQAAHVWVTDRRLIRRSAA